MYTTVYTRVHCIALSMSSVGTLIELLLGLTPRHSRDTKPHSDMRTNIPKEPKSGVYERDHASPPPHSMEVLHL